MDRFITLDQYLYNLTQEFLRTRVGPGKSEVLKLDREVPKNIQVFTADQLFKKS